MSSKAPAFTIGEAYVFEPMKTAGAASAWFCAAKGIRISERPKGGLSEFVVGRPVTGGMQWLARNGDVRKFVTPADAARAALAEWS